MPNHPAPSIKIHDSPLSREIQKYEFLKKFFAPTFDYYFGASDPVQRVRHFQEKMVTYSHNDPTLCLTFPAILKGVTSEWFYSLPPCSLQCFTKVTESFLTQYASYLEVKKSSHHLLSVRMKQGESLKS